jgi:hypothetical protein
MRAASRRGQLARLVRVALTSLPALALLATTADARPEKIRPGMPYYSDDYVEAKGVRDIGAEKNYEEVYQNYTYYEAIYDDGERVVTFIEYEKGEETHREEYAYGPDGALLTRSVKLPGAAPKVTQVDEAESPKPKD